MRAIEGVSADVLNRFFGQKPQEQKNSEQEQTHEAPATEQRLGFLGRTRQLFSRIGTTVQQSDTITDSLWDDLEESLLEADVGPRTTVWLIERLRQRADEEKMRTGAQVQRALREELTILLGKSAALRFSKPVVGSFASRCSSS